MRRLSIFGATGSVGRNTVRVITDQGGPDAYDIVALTGASNVALLAEQARALRARIAVTADADRLGALREALAGSGIRALAGPEGLLEAAAEPADWTMSAIVGAAGLAPGLRSAEHGGTLALANKESLVCAGALLLDTCARFGTTLLPVDSEHSAIFQALRGERADEVERIIVTASGGPFRTWTRARMAEVTPDQAKAHPNWSMGARISIDSATMFNKALELIEAQVMFGLPSEAIEVVVHPQSIVHSMVGFRDGSIMAQLGPSDMRGAIGFALNFPDRHDIPVERLDFPALSRLDFEAPDPDRFPALRLGRAAMEAGGLSGAVLNAAKETALDAFMDGRLAFLDMARVVEHVTCQLGARAAADPGLDLAAVIAIDSDARAEAGACIAQFNGT